MAAEQGEGWEPSRFFRIIGEPNRWRILDFLRSGERCVCEITSGLGLAQNLVSHHLRILREEGLVLVRHETGDGRWSYYRLNQEVLTQRLAEASRWAAATPLWDGPVACDRQGRVARPR